MVLVHLRPLVRLLRKKLVLAIIFALSFSYCMVSLMRENGGNSRSLMGRFHSDVDHDYNDMDAVDTDRLKLFGLRRGFNADGSTKGSLAVAVANGQAGAGGLYSPSDIMATANESDGNGGSDEPKIASGLQTCRNSVQGKVLIADDRGYVCSRKDLGSNGCCDVAATSAKLHSCDTCTDGGCCAIFEYCVSCCLEPAKKQILSKRIKATSNGGFPSNVLYESLSDHFEFCLARCRTSSQSVQHENSYRDPKNKHCYGESATTIKDSQAVLNGDKTLDAGAEH